MCKKRKKNIEWYRQQMKAYASRALKPKKQKVVKPAPLDQDAYDRMHANAFVRPRGLKRNRKRKQKVLKVSKFRQRYDAHIKSPAWRIFAAIIRSQRGGKCEDCGSREHLHVHHIHYQNLGHEKPEDVRLVCKPCHERIHGRKF